MKYLIKNIITLYYFFVFNVIDNIDKCGNIFLLDINYFHKLYRNYVISEHIDYTFYGRKRLIHSPYFPSKSPVISYCMSFTSWWKMSKLDRTEFLRGLIFAALSSAIRVKFASIFTFIVAQRSLDT